MQFPGDQSKTNVALLKNYRFDVCDKIEVSDVRYSLYYLSNKRKVMQKIIFMRLDGL